jgi:dynactin 1
LAFLAFKRIRFKAHLMHRFIKERIGVKTAPGQGYDIFGCCDILDKLIWVAGMCDRFVRCIQILTLEAFGRLEGVIHELEPLERAFNTWIDRMKKDELKEDQCAEELQR